MIAFLKRADHVIFKIQEYICIITSVLITSLIVIAAIMRYILGINFGGSEELVLFAAFWFYFTGSSLAYRDDSHINADMTSLLFKSEKAKKRMAVVKYAVSKQHAAFPPGPFQVPSGIQVSFFIKKQPILTDCFL